MTATARRRRAPSVPPEWTPREVELHAQISKLQDEASEIEGARKRKEAEAFVGRCFRYRNCYSLPKEPSDYWWLYRRVIGLDPFRGVLVCEFERDKDGKLEVTPTLSAYPHNLGEEITVAEYERAWQKELARLRNVMP